MRNLSAATGPLVLDVTLRDGGYLNNWKFSPSVMRRVARGLSAVSVDLVEVGYLDIGKKLGCAARSSIRSLMQLREILGTSCLVVMLRPSARWNLNMISRRAPYIDLIRIPFTADRTDVALRVADACRAANVDCSLNLGSVSSLDPKQLPKIIRRCEAASIFYLADSRGALRPNEVEHLVKISRQSWDGLLGFHAHDNLGLAAANSQAALSAGCDIIDGSINGYGLGGGNLDLRYALGMVRDLRRIEQSKPFDFQHLERMSRALFLPKDLRNAYAYYLSGMKNLEQEWVPLLSDILGEQLLHHISELPRRRYKRFEEVTSTFDGQDALHNWN